MEFLLEGIAPFKMLLGQDIIGRGKLTLSSKRHAVTSSSGAA